MSKPDDPFAWMVSQQVYEPAPTIVRSGPSPIPLRYWLFMAVAALVIGGALAGLA